MEDKYIICSDESGTWSSSTCENYIRAFCIFKEQDYENLKKDYKDSLPNIQNNHPNDFKSLISIIGSIDFKLFIYFNLTCDEKSGLEKAKIVIGDLNFNSLTMLDKDTLINSLKRTVDNCYYLNYIEGTFWDSLIKDSNIPTNNILEIKIENPQFNKKDFKTMLSKKLRPDTKITYIQKKEGETNEFGTQLCDRVCSVIQNFINYGEHKKEEEVTWLNLKLTKPLFSNCNPSKVFFTQNDKNSVWYKNLKVKKWK